MSKSKSKIILYDQLSRQGAIETVNLALISIGYQFIPYESGSCFVLYSLEKINKNPEETT